MWVYEDTNDFTDRVYFQALIHYGWPSSLSLSEQNTNLILFYKPFQVMCQFTDTEGRKTLADYIKRPDFYAAGRLDYDSEGLLLLTNNGNLQHQIANPKHKMPKTYWVQVEGEISQEAILQLQKGVTLKDGPTHPAKAQIIDEPDLPERTPPVRERKNIPTSWLSLTITEGKNRQVRRMTAAVGFPTLRLVRVTIGNWSLDGLNVGEMKELSVNLPKTARAKTTKDYTTKKSKSPKSKKPRA